MRLKLLSLAALMIVFLPLQKGLAKSDCHLEDLVPGAIPRAEFQGILTKISSGLARLYGKIVGAIPPAEFQGILIKKSPRLARLYGKSPSSYFDDSGIEKLEQDLASTQPEHFVTGKIGGMKVIIHLGERNGTLVLQFVSIKSSDLLTGSRLPGLNLKFGRFLSATLEGVRRRISRERGIKRVQVFALYPLNAMWDTTLPSLGFRKISKEETTELTAAAGRRVMALTPSFLFETTVRP